MLKLGEKLSFSVVWINSTPEYFIAFIAFMRKKVSLYKDWKSYHSWFFNIKKAYE